MLTTVDLPGTLYRESEALPAARGVTVEALIVESVSRYVHSEASVPGETEQGPFGDLPVIRSSRPGTLDRSQFDFDDLLA